MDNTEHGRKKDVCAFSLSPFAGRGIKGEGHETPPRLSDSLGIQDRKPDSLGPFNQDIRLRNNNANRKQDRK